MIHASDLAAAPAKTAKPAKRPRFRLTSPTKAQLERATRPKEIQVQCAYVAWSQRLERHLPTLARGFHPANGELRDAKTGAKLKRMGVRAGVLDWFLPVPRGGYLGLWIEFKAWRKKPNDEQKAEIAALLADGYLAVVFDDWEEAACYTLDYLQGKVEKGDANAAREPVRVTT